MYRPKKSIPPAKPRRYLPPVRVSISQETSDIPIDFGSHHCLNKSGCVQAWNTRRAGASNVRVTTSSRSDVRSTVVGFCAGVGSICAFVTIDLLLQFQCFDDQVQFAETGVP